MVKAEQVVFLGASALTVAAGLTGRHTLMKVAKPVMVPALAARVWRRRHEVEPVDTALLATAAAAATAGDVILIDPDSEGNLLRGAAAFAVMQSAYIAELALSGARPTKAAALPRIPLLAAAGALLTAKEGRQALPLGAYGLLLSTAGTLAADPALRPGTTSWLLWGGTLFTLSDSLILARRRLVTSPRGKAVTEGLVLATYAAAQFLLVEGMLDLAAKRKANAA